VLLCSVITGLALVAKHSGILLLPTLTFLALIDFLVVPRQRPSGMPSTGQGTRGFLKLAAALLVIFTVSYVILWAIYCFRYAARPNGLEIAPPLAVYTTGLSSPLKRSVITFLANHHLFPEAYLYGWVDILSIPGTRSAFIFGHVFPAGRWFFFPAVFLIKSTLTLLIFLSLAPFARIRGFRRELLFLAIPVAFFLSASIFSMLNLGVRHILPTYPFWIILAAAAAASFSTRSRIAQVAVTVLLLFTVISSLHSFPDYLAYSNELAGGPSHTYRLVSDSNADWGQGLKWTKTYLDQHPGSDCWMDYTNPAVNPEYYGIHCKPLLSGLLHFIERDVAFKIHSKVTIPFTEVTPIPSTITGTILISGTDAVGLMWGPDNLNPYQVFLNRKPDAIIGNVVLAYHGTFDVQLLAAYTNATAALRLLRQDRTTEAVALARIAAQQAPDSAYVNTVLGQALLASNQVTEGRQVLTTAMQLAQTIHPDFQKPLVTTIRQSLVASGIKAEGNRSGN
jgi:hypothetical protein